MGIVSVFCIVPKCLFRSVCPEAVVAPFLFSVGYSAHGGAIVELFVSGLNMQGTRQNASSKRYCFPDL